MENNESSGNDVVHKCQPVPRAHLGSHPLLRCFPAFCQAQPNKEAHKAQPGVDYEDPRHQLIEDMKRADIDETAELRAMEDEQSDVRGVGRVCRTCAGPCPLLTVQVFSRRPTGSSTVCWLKHADAR